MKGRGKFPEVPAKPEAAPGQDGKKPIRLRALKGERGAVVAEKLGKRLKGIAREE